MNVTHEKLKTGEKGHGGIPLVPSTSFIDSLVTFYFFTSEYSLFYYAN